MRPWAALLFVSLWWPPAFAADDDRLIVVVDQTGVPVDLNRPLKIGQTIGFRFHPTHPEMIDNVRLLAWNGMVSSNEGNTNNVDEAGDFYIPYVIPPYSSSNPLSLDVLVQSKMGGRTHYFFSRPPDWKIAPGSFLESEVDLREKINVDGIKVDKKGPEITEVKVLREKAGVIFQFSVEDELINPEGVKVAGETANCVPDEHKPNLYRCFRLVSWDDLKNHKREVEISAYDKARNYVFRSIRNSFSATENVALFGNPILRRCRRNTFELEFRVNEAVGVSEVAMEEVPLKLGAKIKQKEIGLDGKVHFAIDRPRAKIPRSYGLKFIIEGNNGSQSSFLIPAAELDERQWLRKSRAAGKCIESEIKVEHPQTSGRPQPAVKPKVE